MTLEQHVLVRIPTGASTNILSMTYSNLRTFVVNEKT